MWQMVDFWHSSLSPHLLLPKVPNTPSIFFVLKHFSRFSTHHHALYLRNWCAFFHFFSTAIFPWFVFLYSFTFFSPSTFCFAADYLVRRRFIFTSFPPAPKRNQIPAISIRKWVKLKKKQPNTRKKDKRRNKSYVIKKEQIIANKTLVYSTCSSLFACKLWFSYYVFFSSFAVSFVSVHTFFVKMCQIFIFVLPEFTDF